MDPTLFLLRWAHVLAAIVAMGGLVFARFALLPALSELDASTRDRVHERIRRHWLPWVIGAITLLLASGLANFLLFNARVKGEEWAGGQWMRETNYHALFGAKFLMALVAFYLASALVGRGAGTADGAGCTAQAPLRFPQESKELLDAPDRGLGAAGP